MRQNITREQLDELSIPQLKRLYALLPNPHIMRIAYESEFHWEVSEYCYAEAVHFITIGRLIAIGFITSNVPLETLTIDVRGRELIDVLWLSARPILSN